MGPGIFVIAILGCADGSAQCQPVATLPTRYESRAICAAATTAALTSSTGYDYPELQAECRMASTPRAVQNQSSRPPAHPAQG